LVLAEVHDSANRRHCRRGYLYQIESLLFRDSQCLRWRHDAELVAGVVDYADLANANAFVDSHAIVTSWSSVESDNYLLGSYDVFRVISSRAFEMKSSTELARRWPAVGARGA